MRGLFSGKVLRGGLAAAFTAAAIAFSVPEAATAQSLQDAQIIDEMVLPYIKTGNTLVDNLNEAGLYGLGKELYERTAVENMYISRGGGSAERNKVYTEQLKPRGVDIATDDLSNYTILFWTIDPDQQALSRETIDKLNDYMARGGMLFIDTRDKPTRNRGKAWLRQATEDGLNIPEGSRLSRVEGCVTIQRECSVLGKSFYLMTEFPGRDAGGYLWAETTDGLNNDGVPTVVIGGNDWMSAWAIDAESRPLYPVVAPDSFAAERQRELAYRFGINLFMHAYTGNYKGDQVHVPALLERMGAPQR